MYTIRHITDHNNGIMGNFPNEKITLCETIKPVGLCHDGFPES
jgi:hypothetical protein